MLHSDFSLLQYNTFGIDEQAKFFFSFSDKQELATFLKNEFRKDLPYFVLGGGSNVLLTKPFEGTVIHPENKGISITEERGNDVFVAVAAGEVWDDFVQWAVSNNLHGVENLSYIPGCVGASPVQNIGAYGSEAKDAIYRVVCMAVEDQQERVFSNEECRFGYRDSVFKHEEAGKYIVTEVVFKLQKNAPFNLGYGSLRNSIDESTATLQIVRDTIIAIRKEKLPDPKEIGSAGSFFKNPVVPTEQAEQLKQSFPDMVTYPAPDGKTKIAAGWLIDSLGLKGYRIGGAQVHPKQALVLTNTGGATATDVTNLASHVRTKVNDTYGLTIEPEVIYL